MWNFHIHFSCSQRFDYWIVLYFLACIPLQHTTVILISVLTAHLMEMFTGNWVQKFPMLCLSFIETDGLPVSWTKLDEISLDFSSSLVKKKKSYQNQVKRKILLISTFIKRKGQIVLKKKTNLLNVSHLNTLKIVMKVLHFSLLEKGNKNTLYISKAMATLWTQYIFFILFLY